MFGIKLHERFTYIISIYYYFHMYKRYKMFCTLYKIIIIKKCTLVIYVQFNFNQLHFLLCQIIFIVCRCYTIVVLVIMNLLLRDLICYIFFYFTSNKLTETTCYSLNQYIQSNNQMCTDLIKFICFKIIFYCFSQYFLCTMNKYK